MNTSIDTSRNLVNVLFWAGLMTGLILITQVAAAAGYYEYQNPPCYDISGKTTAVLVGGVNNSGIMNFDDAGVDPKYQACVRMSAAGVGAVPDRLEGWVWNDNLGWISMYCPASGLNLGMACGTEEYAVTFSINGAAPDFTSVAMSGYAWGDNSGYISFEDTVSGSSWNQIKPVSSGVTRGLISSGNDAETHAWSDAIGWFDFSGVQLRWEADLLVVPPLPPNLIEVVTSTGHDVVDAGNPPLADMPVADGSSVYDIKVAFEDGGTRLTVADLEDCNVDKMGMYDTSASGKLYCGRLKITWDDSVDFDQTTKVSQDNGASNPYGSNTFPAGAVNKPLNYALSGPSFVYDAVNKLWGASVKSVAPTSDGNIADGMRLERFNYVDTNDLPDPSYDKAAITNGDNNKLMLKSVDLMLFKYSPDGSEPGECIWGEVKEPVNPLPADSTNPYTCNLHTYIQDVSVPFKPLVAVSKLVHKLNATKELNYINIDNVEALQSFAYDIVTLPSSVTPTNPLAEFDIGLVNSVEYNFRFDDGAGNLYDTTNINSASVSGLLLGFLEKLTAGVVLSADAQPYLFSTVSYENAGQTVKYFSNKLPRIAAGLLKNPVAKVQGNVYLTDFAKKSSSVNLNSLGNISSNYRREAILRNVYRYLGDGAGTPGADQTVSIGDVATIAGFQELVENKVFYLKDANLTIECGGDGCEFDSNVTFIVENGNIFVNSNIVPVDGVQVGLIALRDFEGNKQHQGFLFVDKAVTWLSHVHVYLDRVMQSYDQGSGSFDGTNGFWMFVENDAARQERFKNQLVFEGTIASMNGIGNATATGTRSANDETGGEVVGSFCAFYEPVNGICRARVVDLNYLRYYGPGLEICQGGGVEGPQSVANVPRDQQNRTNVNSGGCDPNSTEYVYNIDAANLFEAQPTYGDLVSGGESKGEPSPYFNGKPASLENEYPVNFFYVPISKDLAGFEQEDNYNPIVQ